MVVPFRAPREQLPTVSEVRSTLLNTSVQALREYGFYAKYLSLLPTKHHEDILSVVAGNWVPIELAQVHYGTCERLDVPASTLFEIGTSVAKRVQGTFLGTVLRLAAGGGVTVWTGLSQMDRLYERIFVGGGCRVTKLGPKEARLEFVQNPLCAYAYYRGGLRGTITASCELFSRKVILREVSASADSVAYRASWV